MTTHNPDWMTKLREAQTIRAARQAEADAREAATSAARERARGAQLAEALNLLGIPFDDPLECSAYTVDGLKFRITPNTPDEPFRALDLWKRNADGAEQWVNKPGAWFYLWISLADVDDEDRNPCTVEVKTHLDDDLTDIRAEVADAVDRLQTWRSVMANRAQRAAAPLPVIVTKEDRLLAALRDVVDEWLDERQGEE